MAPPTVQDSPEGAVLTVHLQPKAARTEHAGLHGDALKVRVAAPPVEGAANDALCRYLAACFGLPTSYVTIRAGAGARRKRVLLKTVTAARVSDVLNVPLPGPARQAGRR